MFGITVNTSYKVPANNPNRSGDYGLVFPSPGKLYSRIEDAETDFAEIVRSHKTRKLGFCATLNKYSGKTEETVQREGYDGDPAKEALYA